MIFGKTPLAFYRRDRLLFTGLTYYQLYHTWTKIASFSEVLTSLPRRVCMASIFLLSFSALGTLYKQCVYAIVLWCKNNFTPRQIPIMLFTANLGMNKKESKFYKTQSSFFRTDLSSSRRLSKVWTVSWRTGCTRSGAISANGAKTKWRRCISGCGMTSFSVWRHISP